MSPQANTRKSPLWNLYIVIAMGILRLYKNFLKDKTVIWLTRIECYKINETAYTKVCAELICPTC